VVVALSQTLLLSAFNSIRGGATSRQGDHQLTKQQQRFVMVYLVSLLALLAEWTMVFKLTMYRLYTLEPWMKPPENREDSRVVFRNVRYDRSEGAGQSVSSFFTRKRTPRL
jgi:hypothetical protein